MLQVRETNETSCREGKAKNPLGRKREGMIVFGVLEGQGCFFVSAATELEVGFLFQFFFAWLSIPEPPLNF